MGKVSAITFPSPSIMNHCPPVQSDHHPLSLEKDPACSLTGAVHGALMENQVPVLDLHRTQAIMLKTVLNNTVVVPIQFRPLLDGVMKEKRPVGTPRVGRSMTLLVSLGNAFLRPWRPGSFRSTHCLFACIESTCRWNMSMNNRQHDLLRNMGTVLIILGVSVWAIYAVLHYILEINVSSRDFLAFHLAGVVPGALLRRHQSISELYNKYVKKA
jgi:hypothetical protein